MSVTEELRTHYSAVRERLRRPPNAVRKEFVPPVILSIDPPPTLPPAEPIDLPKFIPDRPPEILVVDNVEICGPIPISVKAQCLEPIVIEPFDITKVRVGDILLAVASHFNLQTREMLSARRTIRVSLPRQIGMYLARQMTDRSHRHIVRKFGRTDHTTVVHAYKRVEMLCLSKWEVAHDVATIEAGLMERFQQ